MQKRSYWENEELTDYPQLVVTTWHRSFWITVSTTLFCLTVVTESKVSRLHSSTWVLGAKASNHTLLFMKFNSVLLVTITHWLICWTHWSECREPPSPIDTSVTQSLCQKLKEQLGRRAERL